jgi:acetyltransferase-like isoleucine patch superfamily enzyme
MIRIVQKIFRKLLKSFGGKYHAVDIPESLFCLNWWYQRVWRINAEVPFSVHYTTLVSGANNIIIENDSASVLKSFAVSGGCYFGIADGSTLTIGEDTIWAWNLSVQTANHDLIDRNKYVTADIRIGKNCWIGGNVSILPGVELGDHVTVGANSVVTKSFPSHVVIAGCPAKIIRELTP